MSRRLPAPLSNRVLSINSMKSTIATLFAIFFHIVGFSIGASLWAAIGYGFGSVTGTPLVGAITGLMWQLGCYIIAHEQMFAALERSQQKFLYVLQRI